MRELKLYLRTEVLALSVAPSRVRELKHQLKYQYIHYSVAPSRVRELKPQNVKYLVCDESRTLTGAWIETLNADKSGIVPLSRTLTGAWIETIYNGK